MSAALWQVVQRKDIVDYGMLEEFVSTVTDIVPELLRCDQRAQLLLGLRTRVRSETIEYNDYFKDLCNKTVILCTTDQSNIVFSAGSRVMSLSRDCRPFKHSAAPGQDPDPYICLGSRCKFVFVC